MSTFTRKLIDQTVVSIGLATVSTETSTRNYLAIAEGLVQEGTFDNDDVRALYAEVADQITADGVTTVSDRMSSASFVKRIVEAIDFVCALAVTNGGNVRVGFVAEWIEDYNDGRTRLIWSLQNAKMRESAGIVPSKAGDAEGADDAEGAEGAEDAPTVKGDVVASIASLLQGVHNLDDLTIIAHMVDARRDQLAAVSATV
jgi:hypothetical protein